MSNGTQNLTGAFMGDQESPDGTSDQGERAINHFSKLGLSFGGEHIDEFFNRFELHSSSLKWSEKDKFILLQLALRGSAHKVFSQVRLGSDDRTNYLNLKNALYLRFGATAIDNLETLISTRLEDCSSVEEYLEKVQFSHAQISRLNLQDLLIKLFTYRGLPKNNPSTTVLRPVALDESCSVEKFIDAVRVQFHNHDNCTPVVAVAAPMQQQRPQQAARCLICKRNNHATADCRFLPNARRQVCHFPCYSLLAPLPLILDYSIFPLTCLIDSGAQTSLICKTQAEQILAQQQQTTTISTPETTIRIQIVGGERTIPCHHATISILNHAIKVVVLHIPHILLLEHTPVQVILGRDWLYQNSPVEFGKKGDYLVVTKIRGVQIPTLGIEQQDRHENERKRIPEHIHVGAMMEALDKGKVVHEHFAFTDFHAQKVTVEGKTYWEAEWLWKNGSEPKQRTFRPPVYKAQMESLTANQRQQFKDEVEKWKDMGFISKVNPHELMGTITLMAVAQDHKATTPCRPVLDLKPLNSMVVSAPNEEEHVACANTIRRWRETKFGPDGKPRRWVLIDIKKAYLQIRLQPKCSKHLGIRLVNETSGEIEYWRMDRLPFGLNVSPKILRTILKRILKENELDDKIDMYVDDLKVWIEDVDRVRSCLEASGFPTKEPENSEEARVLGLQRIPGNRWKRREPLSENVGSTFTELRSWTASAASSHYPVGRWLRPAVRYLERLGRVKTQMSGTDTLPGDVIEKWHKLIAYIKKAGDPTGSLFMVDSSLPWQLYTDASNLALGAALYFGPHLVEDVSWLRKMGDVRPIDTVELEAALNGLNKLVLPWMSALGKDSISLKLFVDNQPVVRQINRRQAEHSVQHSGYTSGVAEARLQTIEELISLRKIKLDCQYVASAENKADCLTRIPTFLMAKESKGYSEWLTDNVCETVVAAMTNKTSTVTIEGRRPITIDDLNGAQSPAEIKELVRSLHDHEGSMALYHRLRRWMSHIDGLKSICRQVVQECDTCRRCKTHSFQNQDNLGLDGKKRKRKDKRTHHQTHVPFNKVHLDVVGPFQNSQTGSSSAKLFFVLTMVDSATGYALAVATKKTPSSIDVVCLLQHLVDVFHVSPLVMYTDGGSIFRSAETQAFLSTHQIQLQTTAKHSSTSNGKVERFHRTLQEYLRSHLPTAIKAHVGWYQFTKLVQRAITTYNTTPYNEVSAHEKVFRFSPYDPQQPVELREDYELLRVDQPETWPVGFKEQTPILVRNFQRENKLSPYWLPAIVHKRVGILEYSLIDKPGKFSLKDLKPLAGTELAVPPKEKGRAINSTQIDHPETHFHERNFQQQGQHIKRLRQDVEQRN